ncbi:MAG: site-2 protease family protein [Cyanobacteria bacterium P01_H01_bin.153]
MITLLILLAALSILAWGFYRARPYGQLGLFAWLQSAVLMAPWLLFFGLFAAGIYLNVAAVLLLVVLSAGLYIYLGRRLRTLGKDELNAQRAAALARRYSAEEYSAEESSQSQTDSGSNSDSAAASPDAPAQAELEAADDDAKMMPIPREDLVAIEGIFGVDTFFRTETIPYQQGAIFKGNLRGDPEDTQPKLSSILEKKLGDRYRLFLIEGPEGRPVVIVLPSSSDPQPATTAQKVLVMIMGLATLATTLEASGILMGFDFFEQPERFSEVFPVTLGIWTVLITHEMGHWLKAQQYNVKTSPPFFLPTWQIGSFGGLTRFESLLPNRTVLFDVAFAGPAAGGVLSFLMLVMGLVLSHPGSYFQLPTEFFQGSILVGTLARVVLGDVLQQPVVDIHPLTIIGWLGLVITAINLLPAGQLDGGRVVQAIYGRKIAGRTTVVTLIVLAIASLVNPIALYWAILILFLQRNLERPGLNELTEPDDARAALALLALFLTLATLLPLTPSLAGRLGIGAGIM